MPVRLVVCTRDEGSRSPRSLWNVSQRHERSDALALLHPQRITVKRLLGCTWEAHHRGKLEDCSFSAKKHLDFVCIDFVMQQKAGCLLHSLCDVQLDVVATCCAVDWLIVLLIAGRRRVHFLQELLA